MAPPATPTSNRVKAATKLEKDVDSLNEAIRVEIAEKDTTIQLLTEKLASSGKVIAYVEEQRDDLTEKLKVKEEHEISQKERGSLSEQGEKQGAEIVALKQENASIKEELNRYTEPVTSLMSNGGGNVKQENQPKTETPSGFQSSTVKGEGTESNVSNLRLLFAEHAHASEMSTCSYALGFHNDNSVHDDEETAEHGDTMEKSLRTNFSHRTGVDLTWRSPEHITFRPI